MLNEALPTSSVEFVGVSGNGFSLLRMKLDACIIAAAYKEAGIQTPEAFAKLAFPPSL